RVTWGSPFGKPESLKKYVDQSPITYASKIKTPTLIMSDTGDVRVPIMQSFAMYRALRDNGVPVKFVAYPVGGSSPDDPVHGADGDGRTPGRRDRRSQRQAHRRPADGRGERRRGARLGRLRLAPSRAEPAGGEERVRRGGHRTGRAEVRGGVGRV